MLSGRSDLSEWRLRQSEARISAQVSLAWMHTEGRGGISAQISLAWVHIEGQKRLES